MIPVAITGVVTLAGALATIYTTLRDGKKAVEDATGLDVAKLKKLSTNLSTNDLISLTKVCRMEPLVLVDDRLKFNPIMTDMLQVTTSLVAGYYMQAFALVGNISAINVIGTLDKLNPSRTGIGLNSIDEMSPHKITLGGDVTTSFLKEGLLALDEENKKSDSVTYKTDKNSVAELTQLTNLAVGKMIKVTISGNGESVEVPITIRLKPITTDQASIITTLAVGSNNESVKARWMRFKAGELTFSNLVLGDDVIKKHKAALIKDKSGFYAEVVRRANSNSAKGLATGNLSLATDSNIIVLSADTALKASRELGGPLTDFAVRESVFKTIHSNILVIVDDQRDVVNFYYRGERVANTLTATDLKNMNKGGGGGPDIMSIFTAFQENKIPPL